MANPPPRLSGGWRLVRCFAGRGSASWRSSVASKPAALTFRSRGNLPAIFPCSLCPNSSFLSLCFQLLASPLPLTVAKLENQTNPQAALYQMISAHQTPAGNALQTTSLLPASALAPLRVLCSRTVAKTWNPKGPSRLAPPTIATTAFALAAALPHQSKSLPPCWLLPLYPHSSTSELLTYLQHILNFKNLQ
jgi:hypothetical protein